MNRFRRLTVRYKERDDIYLAFATLGCALVCLNQIKRFVSRHYSSGRSDPGQRQAFLA